MVTRYLICCFCLLGVHQRVPSSVVIPLGHRQWTRRMMKNPFFARSLAEKLHFSALGKNGVFQAKNGQKTDFSSSSLSIVCALMVLLHYCSSNLSFFLCHRLELQLWQEWCCFPCMDTGHCHLNCVQSGKLWTSQCALFQFSISALLHMTGNNSLYSFRALEKYK